MIELTNSQRHCLGLEEISETWDKMELAEGCLIYLDGDIIRKTITYEEDWYRESSMQIETQQNRSMIVPKTSRGKLKKLTQSNVLDRSAYGMYLDWDGRSVRLANYTTQVTYYNSRYEGISIYSQEELKNWLEQWETETTEERLQEVQEFATNKRRHCKYKEGDFFRFRFDRSYYGYGRILFDVEAWEKKGNPFWDVLMGKALVVQVYHIVTQDPDIPVQKLAVLPACPSQFIMDNLFYYGECEIVGNMPLTGEVDYPIMYGRSIDALDPDKVIFCQGKMYQEFPLGKLKPIGKKDYSNKAMGWDLEINKNVVEQCIRKKSNKPYWEQNFLGIDGDLRNPENHRACQKLMKQMRKYLWNN